jgi:hypothetical protein
MNIPTLSNITKDITASNGILTSFNLQNNLPLSKREKFSHALIEATPILEACEPNKKAVLQKIEVLADRPVGIISQGPTADHVELSNSFPYK